MSAETRDTLLHGQLQDGLLLEIMNAPAVSGSQSYKELCLAARNEKHLAELHKRRHYQPPTKDKPLWSRSPKVHRQYLLKLPLLTRGSVLSVTRLGTWLVTVQSIQTQRDGRVSVFLPSRSRPVKLKVWMQISQASYNFFSQTMIRTLECRHGLSF